MEGRRAIPNKDIQKEKQVEHDRYGEKTDKLTHQG